MGLPRMERSCEERGDRYGVGSVAILEARSDCLRLLVVESQLVALAEVWGVESLGQLTSRPCVVCTPRDPS